MTRFIEWLEGLNRKETKVRAVLRRSLTFDPGTFPPAYPYVEPFVNDNDNSWRRMMLYLVAGIWAMHWRQGRSDVPRKIGYACADHQRVSRSGSTERRFISLLDADREQLPHRLRQMIALLKEQTIDFDALLVDLLYWNDDEKRTQNAWARDFYRSLHRDGMEKESTTHEDENQ